MPQQLIYANRAAQQAAYRARQLQSVKDLLSLKGLPPMPVIASMPGRARWDALTSRGSLFLQMALEEMKSYHDNRSEAWQDGPKSDELKAKIECIENALTQLQE